jgi:hypothetical protein
MLRNMNRAGAVRDEWCSGTAVDVGAARFQPLKKRTVGVHFGVLRNSITQGSILVLAGIARNGTNAAALFVTPPSPVAVRRW